LDHIKQVLPEPEDQEAKAEFKKNEVKAKTILTESIKDHLIPNVSKLKSPKEMFDALTKLYESKNTNRKLTLMHQLRNVTMNKSKTVTNYFMKISQIKDQLAAIGDLVDDAELVTTTLNGFPSSWDPFVQGICAKSKLPKFDKLWSDCTQEESRLISKSQKANDDEN
jgi:inosine/xanthosine triphosphate pyrophosphatase family protein